MENVHGFKYIYILMCYPTVYRHLIFHSYFMYKQEE